MIPFGANLPLADRFAGQKPADSGEFSRAQSWRTARDFESE